MPARAKARFTSPPFVTSARKASRSSGVQFCAILKTIDFSTIERPHNSILAIEVVLIDIASKVCSIWSLFPVLGEALPVLVHRELGFSGFKAARHVSPPSHLWEMSAFVADGAIRSNLIVVLTLIHHFRLCVVKVHEPMHIVALRAKLAIEFFDEQVLGQLVRNKIVPLDFCVVKSGHPRLNSKP
jgi:hypothetical protein